MKRLGAVALALTLLAVALLAGGGGDRPAAEAAPRPDFVRACDGFSSVRPFRTTERDAVMGRAKLVSFRMLFENAAAERVHEAGPGVKGLKAALVFTGRRDITIAVPESHRGVLGLHYSQRRGVDTVAEADSSVRFRACPRRMGATGFPGAILYAGPWPACVPLDVTVRGGRATRHVLSLGAGRCATPG